LPKILCITSSFPQFREDYAGSFVYALAKDLSECNDFDIDVLTPHTPNSQPEETWSKVRVFRYRYWWPLSGETLCSQGSALVNLKQGLHQKLKLFPLIFFQLLNGMFLQIKYRYDVIHCHWLLPQGLIGLVIAKIFKLPIIVTIHGGDVFRLNGWLFKVIKRLVVSNVSFITVNSSATKKAVNTLVQNQKNIQLIPMGVSAPVAVSEDRKSEIREKYAVGEGPLLLFLGRLVEEKGVGDFLHAVKILVQQNISVKALIVGEGQDRDRFENLSKSLELENVVKFVGGVPPARVYDYYSAADIFIGPSKISDDGWIEGQGLTFIEAMFSGTPVVATDLGGIADTITNLETGVLVPGSCPEKIADAVKMLLQDKSLYESISIKAKSCVEAKFSRKVSAVSFASLINDCLALVNKM